MSALPEFRFDSSQFPADARFVIWRQAMWPTFDTRLPSGAHPERFAGTIARWALGSIVVTEGRAHATDFERSEAQALSDGIDRYSVLLLRQGQARLDFGGPRMILEPGLPVLLDLSRPLTVSTSAVSFIFVNMARDALEDELPHGREGHGLALDGGAGRMVNDQLIALVRHLPAMAPEVALPMARATLDMIAASVVATMREAATPRGPIEVATLRDAKRFIGRHLHDPALSHADICAALDVSRATLYRVFRPLGGVAVYIQQRRLARIHSLLLNPREHRGIAELAAQFGFVSPAHFSRAFRHRFGCSASEARAHRRVPGKEPTAPIVSNYNRWILQNDR